MPTNCGTPGNAPRAISPPDGPGGSLDFAGKEVGHEPTLAVTNQLLHRHLSLLVVHDPSGSGAVRERVGDDADRELLGSSTRTLFGNPPAQVEPRSLSFGGEHRREDAIPGWRLSRC